MKKLLPFFALPLLGLSGCINVPQNAVESGTVSLTVGPFFAQHLTVAAVSKTADGVSKVGNWEGSTTYLGIVTFTQSFHDLVIYPKTQSAPVGGGVTK